MNVDLRGGDWIDDNRSNWDERVPVHVASDFYDQEPHPQKVLVGVTGEVEEFLDSIRERRAPSPSAEESTEALKVVMAFYKAAQSGCVEPVEGGNE